VRLVSSGSARRLDWFRQREAEVETEAADLDAEAEAYREEEGRERRHTFEARWLEYALTEIPDDVQGEVETAIHREVKDLLGFVGSLTAWLPRCCALASACGG